MSEHAELVWHNGEILPYESIAIGLGNQSLNYGLCVIEGISVWPSPSRAYQIFRLREHLDRFAASCALVGVGLPWTTDRLMAACHEAVAANGLWRAYLRPLAVLGEGVLGLARAGSVADVAILLYDTSRFDQAVRGREVRLTTSSVIRSSPRAVPAKAKVSAGYLNSRLALMDAQDRGFDDAVLLDEDGYVAECSVQNLFAVRGRTVLVPESAAALDGITVACAAELAGHLGLTVSRRRLGLDELLGCDAVCVTSTAAGVRPVSGIDETAFDVGNEVIAALRDAYDRAERGLLPAFAHWNAEPGTTSTTASDVAPGSLPGPVPGRAPEVAPVSPP